MDLVCAVVQCLEYLGVQQADEEVEGRIIIRDHGIEGALFLTQRVQVHIVMVGDSFDLRQIEGCQPHSGTHQNAFRCLARSLLENLILPQGNTFRVLILHCPEQQIQRGDILIIVLLHFGIFQHTHHHGKILLIFRRFLEQHEDDGLQQCCLGLRPERVRFMTALGHRGLDQRVDQLQRVLFIPQIVERIIAVRLRQIHQIQHSDVVSLPFQIPSGGGQHLHLRVRDHIVAVCFQNIGLDIAARLSSAAAANDQHIQ